MGKKYDASSIEVIDLDRDRVRANPGLYVPDKKLAGCIHLVREIKDNSDDEGMIAKNKDDSIVTVSYDEATREITVSDKGRGIPHEKLQELCEVLHSSGKFSKGDDNAYKYSSGMNGVGLKITNFLSEYLEVTSIRDGVAVTRKYKEGEFVKEKKENVDKSKHGTITKFKISDKVMKETDRLRCKHIQKMIEEKADACPGLVTIFEGLNKDGKKIKTKYIGLEIEDLIKKYNKLTSKIWSFDFETKDENALRCRLAFGYNAKATEGSNMMGWANYIYNKDGGTHVDAIVDALYDVFSKYMKKSFFTEKEKKNLQIRKEDIRLGLCSTIVILTTKPEFHGQYKEQFISAEIGDLIYDNIKKKLNKLSDTDMRLISTIIKNNIKARMSSQNARATVKKVGNGLSKDKIEKYYPAKMTCETDYRELYLTEGESAGGHVEQARFDFQEVYKLRGKTDNIYDKSLQELSKIDIIQDLSRIIGLVPGKRGKLNQDRILGLSDADPDGLAIRAGLVLIFAVAFPQVIEEGKLFMVEPPLFGFKEHGERITKANKREYITYLQNKFTKKNSLYIGKTKLKGESLIEFLMKNERYIEYLKNVADENVCSEKFVELIVSNLNNIGRTKKDVKKWDELVKKNFSKQLNAEWADDRIIVSGIKNGNYEMIEINDELYNSKKTRRLITLMDQNLGNVYGYNIEGKDEYQDISLYEVFKIFNTYKADNLKRYKGLGEMSGKDLRETCMDIKKQRAVKITFSDVDKSLHQLALWHSKKEKYRTYRREYMLSYIPDIEEIST